jgi:hypothetical protein
MGGNGRKWESFENVLPRFGTSRIDVNLSQLTTSVRSVLATPRESRSISSHHIYGASDARFRPGLSTRHASLNIAVDDDATPGTLFALPTA